MRIGFIRSGGIRADLVNPPVISGGPGTITGDPAMFDFAFISSASSYTGHTQTATGSYNATWTIEGAKYPGVTVGTIPLNGNKKIFFRIEPPSALTSLSIAANSLSGVLPNLDSFTGLSAISCYSNNLTGQFPSLKKNTSVSSLDIGANAFTGPVPDISSCVGMQFCQFNINSFSGSVPSLSTNTSLISYYCGTNQLSGAIPTFAANTSLAFIEFENNQFTSVAGGFAVPATLQGANFSNNLLTQAAVDAILAAFVLAGASGAYTLSIGGTGNATPSAAGLANKATLVGRGWTVTTN